MGNYHTIVKLLLIYKIWFIVSGAPNHGDGVMQWIEKNTMLPSLLTDPCINRFI